MGFFDIFRKKYKFPAKFQDAIISGKPLELAIGDEAEILVETNKSSLQPDSPPLDYSIESLHVIDQLLHAYHSKQVQLTSEQQLAFSAYVFECILRRYGGRYFVDMRNQENPIAILIGEPECRIVLLVMAKVKGRVVNGSEDSLVFFCGDLDTMLAAKVSAVIK